MKLCRKGLHDLDDPAVAFIRPSDGKRRCGPCKREYGAKWHVANPERTHEYSARWRAAHPEGDREHGRTWHEAHPEYAREHAAKWIAANPERRRTNNRNHAARRRARIAQVLATLTPQEWEAILEAAGYACVYCGATEHITQDHLVPISRGGDHTANNVAPACDSCNSQKHTKTVAEFLAEKETA